MVVDRAGGCEGRVVVVDRGGVCEGVICAPASSVNVETRISAEVGSDAERQLASARFNDRPFTRLLDLRQRPVEDVGVGAPDHWSVRQALGGTCVGEALMQFDPGKDCSPGATWHPAEREP